MVDRLTNDELMTRAARGLGKVDRLGPRGVTLVSFEEIEAMAGLLAEMGLVPIYPESGLTSRCSFPPARNLTRTRKPDMAKKTKTKAKASNLPIPQDDSEARSSIREIGDLQRQIARAEADLNDEIAALQERYGAQVEPLRDMIEAKTEGLKMFCEVNRERLTRGGKVKFFRFSTGEISWRNRPAKVSLRKIDDVLATIKRLKLESTFIRVKEEVNKEAMLERRDLASTIAGVTIGSDGEDFIVEPFETELPEGV